MWSGGREEAVVNCPQCGGDKYISIKGYRLCLDCGYEEGKTKCFKVLNEAVLERAT